MFVDVLRRVRRFSGVPSQSYAGPVRETKRDLASTDHRKTENNGTPEDVADVSHQSSLSTCIIEGVSSAWELKNQVTHPLEYQAR